MNPFELFGLPERAALDEEALRTRYLELARQHHPDASQVPSALFAGMQRAHQVLASPGARLRAILEAKMGAVFSLKGSIPGELVDGFMRVGAALAAAEEAIKKKRQAKTALAQAMLAGAGMQAQEQLGNELAWIQEELRKMATELPALDARMQEGDLDTAMIACRKWLYLEKWRDQLRGRVAELL